MGDYSRVPSKISEVSTSLPSNKTKTWPLVASSSKPIREKMIKRMIPMKHLSLEGGHVSRILLFLLKVSALEFVRRVSEMKCPLIWKVLQGLQVLGYLPHKWLNRLAPIKNLARFMQKISRPLLFLSVATTVSEVFENSKATIDNEDDQQQHHEIPSVESTSELGKFEETTENLPSENWLQKLQCDLEKQGIVLPQRINDDELRRFYEAANGNFSLLVKSIRKNIRWRETYAILSPQQLEPWSHLVFWHGYDVMLRPCLVIRLGLACSTLSPPQRPRFTQAIVSQVEHGVLFLVNGDNHRITVLMDCDGLSPFRIPMNMMRSISALMQDHYPNRLAALLVVRLPPVVRVLSQTLLQLLRPATRHKLRVLQNPKALAELLQTAPSFLGGQCRCSMCDGGSSGGNSHFMSYDDRSDQENEETVDGGQMVTAGEMGSGATMEQVARTAVVGMLMVWIFLAYLVGMKDADGGALLFFS